MNEYLIIIKASWEIWFEGPAYPSPTIVRSRSKSLKRTFESPDDDSARIRAKKIITGFKKQLPKEDRGGDDGNSKPEIKSLYFARMLLL